MASVTLSVSEDFKKQLRRFPWVNWSEIAREEALKKLISEEYAKTGSLTDDEWEFCEQIDWHPVDELPIKEEMKREIEKRKKEKPIKLRSLSEIFRNIR
ncbi:MAG TPA: hypothetical protein VJC16_07350 [Candidatus Nanoarchaeia archaeon]|nr:hypothetical protein [Candidatus Nanoarchaeia archaeon]